ncbi:heparinase II/III family protein [Pleionea mediterranea]|uniref:Putative heparinase superfamily protein n=1 Tax=Pleionea mediterranea TaxID=523701 RepID=A0A316FQ35_9GAMM|nr:heparinase II/III family protein [Pleionea mediterranea]PWK50881.1 putative heparinase superfamily protein [Pleionea mediterranea]
MKKLLLVFNTLKYLKWTQLYFRIYRKLVKPKVTERLIGKLPRRNERFVNVSLYDEKITTDFRATFLNYSKYLDLPRDWNDESYSKLWVYNLHYFEDLLASSADEKYSFHLELLDKWQSQNAEGHGNGWEPYPISLRISNILKAFQAGLPLEQSHFESLYAQASYLSNDLEKHLLGNHYFVNLKALLFAGVVFSNLRWFNIAVNGLFKEIPEQTLNDGANFELSPMYHSLILVDMLDIYNLASAYTEQVPTALIDMLKAKIKKMLLFMNLMAHTDSGVSFFNDSVDGIAPEKVRIERYAHKLGFSIPSFDPNKLQAIDSQASGYMIASHSGNKLIFDAANVGPDYIPGHAHADTLSFEFSIGEERVFVNSGTSQYGLGEKRINERKTFSHNTVEVDCTDSSQVWSGFRVGKRARVIERNAEILGSSAVLSAKHNGYKKIFNGPIHKRVLKLQANALRIEDTLAGKFKIAVARFYLHPRLDVFMQNDELIITGQHFEMRANIEAHKSNLVRSTWHPGFGLMQENQCIELEFLGSKNIIQFSWITK